MDQGSSLNFDFNSQAGVMSLLASVRASNLSPVDKNELRDLIFLYTNGGGDVSVKIALEQKLATHKILPPTPKPTPVEPAPVLAFGSSRPAPVFNPTIASAAPTAPVVPAPVAVPVAVAPVVAPVAPVAAAVSVAPAPIPVAPIVSQPAPIVAPPVYVAPVIPTVVPVAVPVVEAQPVPVPTPIPAPAPSVPTPVYVAPITPAPVMEAAAIPVVAQPVSPVIPAQPEVPVSASGVNYLDRIREIKVAVNSKVGNPVNLVDINNEVGREYMNALLDAMKRLSGGVAGGIEVAMQRLETAYKAVEVAVAEHNNQTVPASVPEPVPVAVQPTPAVSIPVVEAPTPAPTPVPAPVPVPTPIPAPAPSVPTSVPVASIIPETFIPVAEEVSIPVNPELVPVENEVTSGFAAPVVDQGPSGFNAPAPTTTVPQPPSLATEQKMRTPQDLPSPSSITTSTSGDPLRTREIDDGLDQLLSDWALFKKSGLFGTGPRGREHPLFKKLSVLQIPLVLAGRFEGSTQEIKQSITDYMNGWRYEQGIIYEQGETFEHYLRRVIKQILDLQKKRKPA